ncbi:MAG: DUF262 domain-containing protein [Prevotellaceae bacterium]|jgi:uncharacterized protein with ParB-like and HNH nuclease domain|nr:DUF262 domain-containing protein [Prevotellaceae bacterium]
MTTEEDKIIKLDSDTASEEQSEEGGSCPDDSAFSDIDINDTPFSVFEYLRQLDRGKIVIQPDFQRNQVWKAKQKSRFIESVLLDYPLPPIYLNETNEANYIVIDGLQRTTALKEFYTGKLQLNKLKALEKFNGKFFKDLPEAIQSKFEDKKLTIFRLKPSTKMAVIYDLFERINTGGTQLNRQEVRSCIFIGASTSLLKKLSEQTYFKNAIDNGVSSIRMKDREVILRYIAFRWFNYKEEYANMSDYIESVMKRINIMKNDEIQRIETDFEQVMTISLSIWGNANFRIPTKHTRGSVNIAVLETVCNYLSYKNNHFIEKNKNVIKSNYTQLIKDPIYLDTVSRSTGTRTKVLDRFRLAHEILNKNTI